MTAINDSTVTPSAAPSDAGHSAADTNCRAPIAPAIAKAKATRILLPFNMEPHDLEFAEHLAEMAHRLCMHAINDPDEHECFLEGAKVLIEKSRAITIGYVEDERERRVAAKGAR